MMELPERVPRVDIARTNDTNVVAKAVPNPSVPNPCHPCPIRAQLLKPMIAQIAVREPSGQAILNLAGVRGSRTHPGLPRSPTTVLKTAGTTGHHPLPGAKSNLDWRVHRRQRARREPHAIAPGGAARPNEAGVCRGTSLGSGLRWPRHNAG